MQLGRIRLHRRADFGQDELLALLGRTVAGHHRASCLTQPFTTLAGSFPLRGCSAISLEHRNEPSCNRSENRYRKDDG